MRIAVLNWNNRRFGGTGSYLNTVMSALHAAGHSVGLWHEVETPAEYPTLSMPSAAPVWSVSALGLDAALDRLRGWRPDVLYAHGLGTIGRTSRARRCARGLLRPQLLRHVYQRREDLCTSCGCAVRSHIRLGVSRAVLPKTMRRTEPGHDGETVSSPARSPRSLIALCSHSDALGPHAEGVHQARVLGQPSFQRQICRPKAVTSRLFSCDDTRRWHMAAAVRRSDGSSEGRTRAAPIAAGCRCAIGASSAVDVRR